MAACNATHGKPATAKRAMALERLDGIRGAAWIITTRGGQERRDRYLVAAHEQNENGAHDPTLRGCFVGGDTFPHSHHIYTQRFERGRIRFALRPDDDIERGSLAESRKQHSASELAEPSFHSVAVDG